MDYTIKIGGEAGQGIQTIGETLGRVFSRAGHSVFTHQDYESRVRGGHNFFQIRFADTPVRASRERIDILVALDRESIGLHAGELAGKGQIIYDSAALKEKHDGPQYLDVPFTDLALRHGGNRIMANTVATGAVLGMLGMDRRCRRADRRVFRKKGDAVITANGTPQGRVRFRGEGCLKCSFTVPGTRRDRAC
jgi:2-oxoglutarate ferredoxin oxidoreductase subunit alpha